MTNLQIGIALAWFALVLGAAVSRWCAWLAVLITAAAVMDWIDRLHPEPWWKAAWFITFVVIGFFFAWVVISAWKADDRAPRVPPPLH